MKHSILTLAILLVLTVFGEGIRAQESSSTVDKNFDLTLGLGYFGAQLKESGISYGNAQFDPKIGAGLSYFTSVDYNLTDQFSIGLGFNGNYAGAEFIKNAEVDGQIVNGYLEGGAIANMHLMLNLTYSPVGEGLQPFGKLGIGYFVEQVELGDVPLALTGDVETEIFPDYKSSGLGILPEIGARYNSFIFSAAYSIPFDELTGETVPGGYLSTGSITSQGIQVNIAYRMPLF